MAGGQQGPIIAALGADVTVFDNSKKQLEKDEFVARRDNLRIKTVEYVNFQGKEPFYEKMGFDIIPNGITKMIGMK